MSDNTPRPLSPFYGAVLDDNVLGQAAILSMGDESGAEADEENDVNVDDIDLDVDEDADADVDESSVGLFQPTKDEPSIRDSIVRVLSRNSLDGVDSSGAVSDGEMLRRARNHNRSLSWHRRPAMPMICAAIFLFFFSSGFSLASELQLILEGVCYRYNSGKQDPYSCNSPVVQRLNAQVQKWISLTAVISILVSGKIGKLSDIHGRRPVLLFTFLCNLASRAFLLLVLTPQYFSGGLLLLAAAIESFGGSTFVLIGIANSYVVDVVDDTHRMQAMGQLVAYMNFGMGLGPLCSSIINLSPRHTLEVSVILRILTVLLCAFFLPESRPAKLRTKARRLSSERRSDSTGVSRYFGLDPLLDSFKSLKLLWVTRYDNEGTLDRSARINVLLLVFINVIIMGSSIGFALSTMLYATFAFDWEAGMISLFLGIIMLLRAMVLLFFNPWFFDKLHHVVEKRSDRLDYIDLVYLVISLFSEMCVQLVGVVAGTTQAFLLIAPFEAFASLGSPTLHSSLVKYSPSSGRNGEFFGALALITNMVTLLAPMAGLSIYSASLNFNPRMIFYVATGLFGIALGTTLFLRVK
ncbi:DEKNAAC105464 [Brettanomyces naardenensis]|uniref:DEKNAAC105464 n=1 Tax=Brettanomyces naardenensis TaxID=13370 RepID=A0A448YTB7_BRENA|nr:DEKNAAC105464 [Brettanomyces naardenensis]